MNSFENYLRTIFVIEFDINISLNNDPVNHNINFFQRFVVLLNEPREEIF